MINGIDLANMRNAAFLQFNKDFAGIVNRHNPTTLMVQPQYTGLMTKITEIESLYKTAVTNPMTAEIEALDQSRDRTLIGLIGQVRSFMNHFDADMVTQATLLDNNLKLYGSEIAKQTLQEETTIISNLVADWQTLPELMNAVDMLGLLEWTLKLKTINEDFASKYLDRTQSYGSASPETLKAKRTEVMTAYYALRNRLQAYAEIEGTAVFTTTINELNALIEQASLTLRGRTTKTTEEVSPN